MQLKIFTSDGLSCREFECSGFPQFEGTRGIQAVRDTVLAYQANRRQGNACTKQRGEVSGTGKKPWRQKGTGGARHGSRRSPIWPGGGIVFGPRPHDYTQKINRKVKVLALSRALFDIAKTGELNLIEAFKVSEPKTHIFYKILENIFPLKGKVLIIDDCFDDTIIRAARNLERIYFAETASLNAWDFVRFQKVIISEKALNTLLSRLNSEQV